MYSQLPFVLHPRAPDIPFPCLQILKSSLPFVPSELIPLLYLPILSAIAIQVILNMPATSSSRQITEARASATSSPYRSRLITYSKKDQRTRSRRTLSQL
ncbi:hypothetical protein FB446DRAFT_795974 [Lentinula raphanica]|nr:hypothetical protein FB446DRAFT_795974 [Lentinula raphanica]